jgi:hypothetical protein
MQQVHTTQSCGKATRALSCPYTSIFSIKQYTSVLQRAWSAGRACQPTAAAAAAAVVVESCCYSFIDDCKVCGILLFKLQ